MIYLFKFIMCALMHEMPQKQIIIPQNYYVCHDACNASKTHYYACAYSDNSYC